MKTLNLVSAMSVAILLLAPVFVQAQGFRSPYGGSGTNANPSRTFLGLPIPQQWSGNRPAAMNQYSGSGAYRSNSYNNQYSGEFAKGQCTTGNCPIRRNATVNCSTGNCANGTCRDCNCPNGACANGLCASGQCPTCANGQCAGCANGRCGSGQSAGGNCPNGQCRLNQNPNARDNSGRNYGVQGDWSPRTTRSNSADPFRQPEYQNENDNWTQRPALRNPVSELYPSRYNQSDLDLRRPYFSNQSGELNNSGSGDGSSTGRDTRAPHPSDRSMFGAPADRADGLARI